MSAFAPRLSLVVVFGAIVACGSTGSDTAPADSGPNCPARSQSTCTDPCAWVTAQRVDRARSCTESVHVSFCMRFRMAPAIVSCSIRISTGELYVFSDALMPPDADYTDWRACTTAETSTLSAMSKPC